MLDLGCLISASLLRRLQGLVRCPQRFYSSRLKIFLEVGAQLDQFRRCWHWPELRAGSKHFKHLLEIILIVGAQKDYPARREYLAGEAGETLVNQPVSPMFSLR